MFHCLVVIMHLDQENYTGKMLTELMTDCVLSLWSQKKGDFLEYFLSVRTVFIFWPLIWIHNWSWTTRVNVSYNTKERFCVIYLEELICWLDFPTCSKIFFSNNPSVTGVYYKKQQYCFFYAVWFFCSDCTYPFVQRTCRFL